MLRSIASKLGIKRPSAPIFGSVVSVSVSDRKIHGWISTKNKPVSNNLRILLNEEDVDFSVAFTAGGEGEKFWRFEATIKFVPRLMYLDKIVVSYGRKKRQLAGSPWTVRSHPKQNFEIAFMHIPKTAGTSLRLSLERAVTSDCVFPNDQYLRRRGGGYPKYREFQQGVWGLSDQVKLLQGHMSLKQLRILAPRALVVTIFREPIERAVSLVKHKLAAQNVVSITEDQILQRLLAPEFHGVVNGQVRALLGAENIRGSDSEIIHAAISKLAEIDVLGTSRDYKDVLDKLGHVVGTPLEYHYLNESQRPHTTFSASFLERLRELNHLDIQLYEAVLAEVARRRYSLRS